jgi:hypothetical protein
MTKKRYWTQFGYTPQEAMCGWKEKEQTITAPWSSQTMYYMENIVECSSLFLVDHSIFWGTKKLKCTLFSRSSRYIRPNMARKHYLGYYFDHEIQDKETTAIGD